MDNAWRQPRAMRKLCRVLAEKGLHDLEAADDCGGSGRYQTILLSSRSSAAKYLGCIAC